MESRNITDTAVNIYIEEVDKKVKDLLYRQVTLEILQEDFSSILKTFLEDERKPSQPSSSNTGDNMENNIFACVFSFIEEFTIDAASTAFRCVYPKIAGSFQLEQDQHSQPIGEVNDMSFELDQGDTNSANDDSDSIDIVISDNISHQSRQVQPFITVTTTSSQTPSRRKRKKDKKLKQKAETRTPKNTYNTGIQFCINLLCNFLISHMFEIV
ncbi:hypothetical protein RhiirA4_540090 [Rhizophagus irregularis]|uniref:Uncharacterized protein n=1 Tax=Rhizophagus irregularis TaxID=588596 RepID=A0A2I1G663_9GLOM|nr:hypothetical protein RhiirA4_540090 [Rhizophagus irregularis]